MSETPKNQNNTPDQLPAKAELPNPAPGELSTAPIGVEIQVGPNKLLLSPEQAVALEQAVVDKSDEVRRNTAHIQEVITFLDNLGEGWQVSEQRGLTMQMSTSVEEGVKAAIPRLKQRQAEYETTEEGQKDVAKRRMKQFAEGSSELTAKDEQEIAASLGFHPTRSEKVFKSRGERRIEDARAMAATQTNRSHNNQYSSRQHEVETVVRTAYYKGQQQAEEFNPAAKSVRPSEVISLDKIKQMMHEVGEVRDKTAGGIQRALEEDVPEKLFSEIAQGITSWDEIQKLILKKVMPSKSMQDGIEYSYVLKNSLDQLQVKLINQYPESSLAGLRYGEAEQAVVLDLLQSINEVRRKAGLKTSDEDHTMQQIGERARGKQLELVGYVDDVNTLYWHFTPVIRKVMAAKQLQPNSEDGVSATTNDNPTNASVHFIKPGDWPGHSVVTDRYLGYAGQIKDARHRPLDRPLGAAIVLPLREIVKTAPTRNEGKEVVHASQHLSTDATFRDSERKVVRSFDLENAFIVPAFTSDQVAFDERMDVDPATGHVRVDDEGRPLRHSPVREALEELGYTQEWIDIHLVDLPYKGEDHYGRMREAQKEIQTRIAQLAAGDKKVVVPLRSASGALETLDGVGFFGSGKPIIEKLIMVDAA